MRRRGAIAGTLLVLFFTAALLHAVSSYWRFFHMGTAGGNGMALVMVALPAALLVFGLVAAGTHGLARRMGLRPAAKWAATLVAMGGTAILLLHAEIARTADYPQESGEKIDVREFWRAYHPL